MMLFLIILIASVSLAVNFKISNKDFMNPAVIFSLIFLAQAVMCVLALTYMRLTFHIETVLILTVAFAIFTLFNFYYSSKKQTAAKISLKKSELTYINLPTLVSVFFIGLLLVVIFLKYQHLTQLANALDHSDYSLSQKISLFDDISKFRSDYYRELGIIPPRYYNIFKTISFSFGYVTLFVAINNFIACKKIKIEQIITLLLMCIAIYLAGSRSPILRMVTFAVCVYYILYLKKDSSIGIKKQLLQRLLIVGIVTVVLSLVTIGIFGRSSSYNLFHYLFIYTGAPLYNLDVFIQTYALPIPQEYFGQQTFSTLYNYVFAKIGKSDSIYTLDIPFVRYSVKYGLGNVYTTFYQFIYDFGLFFWVPVFTIIPWYYSKFYDKIVNHPVPHSVIDFRLFIYAYLFNDLCMLFFSNRFYEAVLNVTNLEIFIIAYLLSSLIFTRSLGIGKYKLQF
ncbi:O-antigen polymerase [Streptococcus caviae]|uniref:O-antigen polymerase n=1 Tax=Streptococcus sp. 'caviae' TaxID=1915004 RepID=UPI00094BB757|nr:O-antigen polymerase [Streptococcus sp. 'caviae']OLN83025.1 oligosaccharide repeat-containing polymerase [Streptococcus sp. 'caviae']